MHKLKISIILTVLLSIFIFSFLPVKVCATLPVIEDFEDGDLQGWHKWGDVTLSISVDSPPQGSYMLKAEYDMSIYSCGFQFNLTSDTNWISYNALRFYLKSDVSWNILSVQIWDNSSNAMEYQIVLNDRFLIKDKFVFLRIPFADLTSINGSNLDFSKIKLLAFQFIDGNTEGFYDPVEEHVIQTPKKGVIWIDYITLEQWSEPNPFIPSRYVIGAYPCWYNPWALISFLKNNASITHVNPSWYRLNHTTKDGSIVESYIVLREGYWIRKEIKHWSRILNKPFIPLINNFDENLGVWNYETINTILKNSTKRSNLVNNLLNDVIKNKYQGICIDFEGIDKSLRQNMTLFMEELYNQFHSHNLMVILDTPAKEEYLEGLKFDIPFDEGSGAFLYERLHEIEGYIYNNAAWISGKFRYALNFNGINQSAYFNHNDYMIFSNALTVSVWVKRNTSGAVEEPVIAKEGVFLLHSSRVWQDCGTFHVHVNGSWYGVTTTNPIGTQWTNLIGVFDGQNQKLKIYVNGVLNNSIPVSVSNPIIDTALSGLEIGKRYESGRYSNIAVDEVKLFNRVLNDLEIGVLYRSNRLDNMNEEWSGWVDLSLLDDYSDVIVSLCYDKYGFWYNPDKLSKPRWEASISPMNWVESVMDFTGYVVSNDKLLLGVGAYGYDWGCFRICDLGHATQYDMELIARYNPTVYYDVTFKTPMFQYEDEEGRWHTVHFQDAYSLYFKLKLALDRNLKGVRLWYVGIEQGAGHPRKPGYGDTLFWDFINQYRNGTLETLSKLNWVNFKDLNLHPVYPCGEITVWLPVLLAFGLFGFGMLILSPTYIVYKIKEHEYITAFCWGFLMFIIGIGCIIAWLWG